MNAIEWAEWLDKDYGVAPCNKPELAGLLRRLHAENERLTAENEAMAKDAAIHAQIQRACGELPEGYEIRLSMENGAGWVDLFDDHGDHREFDSNHESLAETISDAIDAAMEKTK